MPGRPQVKFEFNLNNIDACFEELSSLCSNASTKVKVQSLSSKLSDLFRSNKEKTTQTEERNEDEVLDDVLKLPDDEMEWIFRNIWNNINSTKKCNYIFDFFSSLNPDEQCDLFGSERSLSGADVVGGSVGGSVCLSVPIMLYSFSKGS